MDENQIGEELRKQIGAAVQMLISSAVPRLNKSFDFLPPNQATLSRHSFLGPNGLKSQWVAPTSEIKV
ncbi:unnamed protein product [Arabidopsis halleri]